MSANSAPVVHQAAGHTEVAEDHGPTLLGLSAEGWVYVGVTIFILLAIFVGKAPKKITDALDAQIAEKRASLDEAARIRAEAQAMLQQAKELQAASATEAAAMLEHARTEAAHIVAQAEADTAQLIERRGAMAEAKIGAAERAAVDSLRRETANVATEAARTLIAGSHSEAADRKFTDEMIASL